MDVRDLQRETILLEMIAERNQIILNQNNIIKELEQKIKELEDGSKREV